MNTARRNIGIQSINFFFFNVVLVNMLCILREREKEREKDFKELTYMIVGAGKSEICRTGQ